MFFPKKSQIKRRERGKKLRCAAMLKIRQLSPLKGHSRYFASQIKNRSEKVNYCIKPCITFCARQIIYSWQTTEGYCFSIRFDIIYSLFWSYLSLANYCYMALPWTGKKVYGFARDWQSLPRVCLICAEERFQLQVSVGGDQLVGGNISNLTRPHALV